MCHVCGDAQHEPEVSRRDFLRTGTLAALVSSRMVVAIDAAIKVLKNKVVLPGHLPALITAIKPAVIVAEKTQTGNLLDNAVTENVRRQVTRLKSSPPIVQKLYVSKKIDIVGGVYDLA